MEEYAVEFTVTVTVHADDVGSAIEKAKQQADIKDAHVYVDGNYYM